jgi:hypothetical protein
MNGSRWISVAALAALLTGCGGSEQSPDDRFIGKLDDNHSLPTGFTDSNRNDLIQLGRNWCDFLATPGITRADVRAQTDRIVNQYDGQTALSVVAVLGAAAQVYCPDAASAVPSN